jgi:homoserine O-acetyltransferase
MVKSLNGLLCLAMLVLAGTCWAAEVPAAQEGDALLKDFSFRNGQSLSELRMHYRILGSPQRDRQGRVCNAVLILHGTTGSGAQFLRPEFADELYGPGQPLDARKHFLILPDNLGHGKSSKPSDGLRTKFPKYGYLDMIEAQYRLLTEGLKVDHLRLVIGTSMGGMHTWLWGQLHPDFMDSLMPLASLPTQISGRNRVWRRMIIDAIENSPDWQGGDYAVQPSGLKVALETLYFMSSNPLQRLKESPTLVQADKALDAYVANGLATMDASDVLYAVRASEDYDPAPGLAKIRAPLLAVNFADDLINPPDLGVLEREIKQVRHGRAILMPETAETVGHGTHTKAAVWKKYLVTLLRESQR